MRIQDIINASFNATNVFYFKSQRDSNGDTVMIGGIIESTVVNDYFKDYEDYEKYVYLSALSHNHYLRKEGLNLDRICLNMYYSLQYYLNKKQIITKRYNQPSLVFICLVSIDQIWFEEVVLL